MGLSGRGLLRVTAIDVGEGDCILVQTPTGRTMLIDGGGTHGTDRAGGSNSGMEERAVGEKVVVPFLRSRGISEIDVLVITHPHGDHVGGLGAVVRDLQVESVLDGTTLAYPSATYRNLVSAISAKHIPRDAARRGDTVDFGDGVRADILNPPNIPLIYGSDFGDKTINNYSAVLRLSYKHTTFLLDGDAEVEAEQNMLAAYPLTYLKADVLKAGHHGSRNASSDAWLDAVQPRTAIICCGRDNLFRHPHPETLARLADHHVQVYRTDLNGSVEADSDGSSVTTHSAT